MTEIKVRQRNGEIELYMVGHAEDKIVCAGVSAIIQTAILGLQNLAEQYPDKISFEIKGL